MRTSRCLSAIGRQGGDRGLDKRGELDKISSIIGRSEDEAFNGGSGQAKEEGLGQGLELHLGGFELAVHGGPLVAERADEDHRGILHLVDA